MDVGGGWGETQFAGTGLLRASPLLIDSGIIGAEGLLLRSEERRVGKGV